MPNTRRNHAHRAIPGKSKDRCWIFCVTPCECAANPHRQAAHGNITRVDRCACGAVRETEINGGRANYGVWQEGEEY